MEKRYYPPKKKGNWGTVSGFFLIIGALISIIASIFFAATIWVYPPEETAQAADATVEEVIAVVAIVTTILLTYGVCGMVGGICAIKRRFWSIAFLGGLLCLWTFFGLLGTIFLCVGRDEFPTIEVKLTKEEKEKDELFGKILKMLTVSSIVIIVLVLAFPTYFGGKFFGGLYYPLLLICTPIFMIGLTVLLARKRRIISSMDVESVTIKLRCPSCKQIFTVEVKPKPFKVKCPHCGREGVIK